GHRSSGGDHLTRPRGGGHRHVLRTRCDRHRLLPRLSPPVPAGAHMVDRVTAHSMLGAPIEQARYVDSARAQALRRLGLETVGDLLTHIPFRYIDLTKVSSLRDLRPGLEGTAIGRVHEVQVK